MPVRFTMPVRLKKLVGSLVGTTMLLDYLQRTHGRTCAIEPTIVAPSFPMIFAEQKSGDLAFLLREAKCTSKPCCRHCSMLPLSDDLNLMIIATGIMTSEAGVVRARGHFQRVFSYEVWCPQSMIAERHLQTRAGIRSSLLKPIQTTAVSAVPITLCAQPEAGASDCLPPTRNVTVRIQRAVAASSRCHVSLAAPPGDGSTVDQTHSGSPWAFSSHCIVVRGGSAFQRASRLEVSSTGRLSHTGKATGRAGL